MARVVELVIDEENFKDGVFCISVVDEPAIESNFLALKKEGEEIQLKTVNEDKRILIGAVLIPNKPILRKDKKGEPYYIVFSKETIEKASQIYQKKGNQNNASINHSFRLEGATVVETWLKEDEVHDKSVKYDLDAPLGSWLIKMKIENSEIWEEYIKTGELKGFSIEGLFEDATVVEAKKEVNKDAEEVAKYLGLIDSIVDELIK